MIKIALLFLALIASTQACGFMQVLTCTAVITEQVGKCQQSGDVTTCMVGAMQVINDQNCTTCYEKVFPNGDGLQSGLQQSGMDAFKCGFQKGVCLGGCDNDDFACVYKCQQKYKC